MIKRFYVNNFRILENFTLSMAGKSSVLLVGKNGAGKSTIGAALEILQRVARGLNRVGELVVPSDLFLGQATKPMRFELEVELQGRSYAFVLAFEFPPGFRELRVLKEELKVDGSIIYTRDLAQVSIPKNPTDGSASFRVDWHLVALPIIQEQSQIDPIFVFKRWLANSLVLSPVPSMFRGDSDLQSETLHPAPDVSNLGAWFSGLLASRPSSYAKIDSFLRLIMPDLQDIQNPTFQKSRALTMTFSGQKEPITVPFDNLSDGEKCFMVFALTVVANDVYGPLLCFWDEPDNYLAPSEINQSIIALRKAFLEKGQLIITSHNLETMLCFSEENTLLVYRNSHCEPTIIRNVEEMWAADGQKSSFIEAYRRGDVGT